MPQEFFKDEEPWKRQPLQGYGSARDFIHKNQNFWNRTMILGGVPMFGAPDDSAQSEQKKSQSEQPKEKPKKKGKLPRPGQFAIAAIADLLLNKGRGDLLGSFLSGFERARTDYNDSLDEQSTKP